MRWKRKENGSALGIGFLIPWLLMAASACSPGMFFGNGTDSSILNIPSYHPVQTACAGLKLSSATIDVPTLRGLLDCFNSNHSLDPLANLVHHLSDSDLAPLVRVSNQYLLQNKTRFFQLDQTYQALNHQGIFGQTAQTALTPSVLGSLYSQLGRFLENKDFLVSTINLLRDSFYVTDPTGQNPPQPDRNLLKLMRALAPKLTYDNAADGIGAAVATADSNAFYDLEHTLKGNSPAGRKLDDVTGPLLKYLMGDPQDPSRGNIGYEFTQALLNDQLFPVLDSLMGNDQNQVKINLPRMSASLKALLADNADVLSGMNSLFYYLNGPITCMKGSESVPNGDMYMLEEIARIPTSAEVANFINRGELLTLLTLEPLCDYPPQLAEYYPAVKKIASEAAIEPTADMMRSIYNNVVKVDDSGESHPLAQFLVKVMSDTGLKFLMPMLAELYDRGSIDSALLLGALLPVDQEQKVIDAVTFLTKPSQDLDGKSPYDILITLIPRVNQKDLDAFILGAAEFLNSPDSDQPMFSPIVHDLRTGYYVNDAHPFVDMTHDFMSDALKNQDVMNSLFVIANRPEFPAVLDLLSKMARDGSLKQLGDQLMKLFHDFAMEGKTDIHAGTEPPQPIGRHNLKVTDLNSFKFDAPEPTVANEGCANLDLNFELNQYADPGFKQNIGNYLSCLNTDGGLYPDVVQSVNFLENTETESGKSYYGWFMDLFNTMSFDSAELRYVTDGWMNEFESADHQFDRTLQSLWYWINYPLRSASDATDKGGDVLRPLLDLAAPIMSAPRDALDYVEKYLASVITQPDVPQLMQYMQKIGGLSPAPEPSPEQGDYDINRIMRWVGNKECENLASDPTTRSQQEFQRANEIIADYDNAVTSWSVDASGRPLPSWSWNDFQSILQPLFDKFSNPSVSSAPGRPVLNAVVNIMGYFTLDPNGKPNQSQHFPPSYLEQFLRERSNDYKLITYYYPGDPTPRVRLVSSLDRLELVLINVDFMAPWPISQNFGLKFLQEMALAWGDEPYDMWPDEVKQLYPKGSGKMPLTLAQVVAQINSTQQEFENIVGFPPLPGCKQVADPNDPPDVQAYETSDPHANTGGLPNWLLGKNADDLKRGLYNSYEVQSVLNENLPGSGSPLAGGMKVVRDLTFELYRSTPTQYRNPQAGDNNNLSVLITMSRLGLLHQSGRALRQFSSNDPALSDFFTAMLHGGISSGLQSVLDDLFINDPSQQLVWQVLKQIFDTVGTPDEPNMKQMAFYTLAMSGQLLSQPEQLNLIDPVMGTLGVLLHQYRTYLTQNAGSLANVFRSQTSSYFTRALYEDDDMANKLRLATIMRDALSDPNLSTNAMSVLISLTSVSGDPWAPWKVFVGRMNALAALPAYQDLNMAEMSGKMMDFLEEKAPYSSDPEAIQLNAALRQYLADRLAGGDIDQFLLLAKNNPDDLYKVLKTVSHYSNDGQLKEFFDTIYRSLSQTGR